MTPVRAVAATRLVVCASVLVAAVLVTGGSLHFTIGLGAAALIALVLS